jgi:uncharacterized NAD(P)/FAD-binding protein YdhS
MSRDSIRDVVIIGGGASAALLSWSLAVRHGRTCTVIDPSDRPAFGIAYSTPSLRNLLNVSAKGMSADPEDPGHFLRWMRQNVDAEAAPDGFVPRAIYGLYLRQLFCAAAPEHERATAIACRREEAGFRVVLAGGSFIWARQVVLACGHLAPARLPGIDAAAEAAGCYHHNAWAETVFAGIAPDDEVALIGTGLTTVDVVLRLREYGHCGRITALSGRGTFPARHADYQPLPAPVFGLGDTAPTAVAYLRAFRAALNEGIEWRAALDSLRPALNSLWAVLPDCEKRRFRRHLQRRWDVYRHRMAPHVADLVEAEQHAGSLQVVCGRVVGITPADGGLTLAVATTVDRFEIRTAHAINCTGPSLNYRRTGSPLLRSMIENGDLVPGLDGGGLRCTPDGELIDAAGAVMPDLLAIGPARQGVLFESIAIPELRQQARDLAARLANAPRFCRAAA